MSDYGRWLSFRQAPVSLPPVDSWLEDADHRGLTLYLAERHGLLHPAIAERRRKNCLRLAKLTAEAARIVGQFQQAGLRAAILKGFSAQPHFVDNAALRVQYDLDFFLSPSHAAQAFQLLRDEGFETLGDHDAGPASHLPALIRKTGYEWRGDLFDPDLPIAVELHSRLWNPEFEEIKVEFPGDPLERLERLELSGQAFPVLAVSDQLIAATLHHLKHVFRGGVRASQLYELASFLARRQNDEAFWSTWRGEQSESLRRVCLAGFLLACAAFDADLPEGLERERGLLPRGATEWMEMFSHTALQPERSGKAETLLHLALVNTPGGRAAVLRRRLLPRRLPAADYNALVPRERITWRKRWWARARASLYLATRAVAYLRALPGFAWAAARWWWRVRGA